MYQKYPLVIGKCIAIYSGSVIGCSACHRGNSGSNPPASASIGRTARIRTSISRCTNRDNITALAALLGYGSISVFQLVKVTCQKWQRLTHKGGNRISDSEQFHIDYGFFFF